MLNNRQFFSNTTRLLFCIHRLTVFKDSDILLKKWLLVSELRTILKLICVTRKTNNYFLNLPANNQKTRSKTPRRLVYKWRFMLYKFVTQFCGFKKSKISKNFTVFDYVNRLWYKQWYNEWFKIRIRRIQVSKITYKNRTNINFPILQYKHVIRNFKVLNKKKQKFINHFNLGFAFFEYIRAGHNKTRFNKNVLKRKYSKFFLSKPNTFSRGK